MASQETTEPEERQERNTRAERGLAQGRKSRSLMKVDEKDYFAFIGFSLDTDPYDNCTLIKEYCFDHLPDFNLQVIGYSQHTENGELAQLELNFLPPSVMHLM